MGDVVAFGMFQKKNGDIFRKSAYLQWGTKKESIGSFLLLNPGNAKSSDLHNMKDGVMEQHRVDLDPTMRQMVKLVEKVYSIAQLNGRVHIYNLFSLRNPQNVDAILNFERLAESNEIEPLEDMPSIEELRKHPWICCGWGINSEKRFKNLQKVKSSWNARLEESSIPHFGKLHQNGIDYYHLRPRLKEKQEKLIEELLDIFRTKIEITNSVESYWVSVVYFEEEYIIIIDNEPFKEVEPIVTIDCENLAEVRTVIEELKTIYGSEGPVLLESLISDYVID